MAEPESVVITSRTDYELGALGNVVATYDDGALGQASELHHEFGVIDKLGARRYWIKDQLGSVRAVVRDGTVVEWNDYYAYGAVRDKWSLADGRWKYLGKELDNETNALDFGARLLSLDASVWLGNVVWNDALRRAHKRTLAVCNSVSCRLFGSYDLQILV